MYTVVINGLKVKLSLCRLPLEVMGRASSRYERPTMAEAWLLRPSSPQRSAAKDKQLDG